MNGLLQHRRILLIVSTVIMVAVCQNLQSQVITARAVLDTNQAFIGDQLRLHLIVEKPVDVTVIFPRLDENLSDQIVIVDKTEIDTLLASEGFEELEQQLVIAAFDTGSVEVPSFSFVFHAAQFSDTLKTLPSVLEINSLQLDEDIRDIKSNYRAPVTLLELAPYLLSLFLVVLLIWLIRRYYLRKYGKIPVTIASAKLDPPDINAINELERLRKDAPWTKNRIKYYYVTLSEIVRNYIEQQFHIAALERTTGEIMHAMEKFNEDKHTLQLLSDMLSLADLVKFAKVIPGQRENADQIDLAIEYVKRSSDLINNKNQERPEAEVAIETER